MKVLVTGGTGTTGRLLAAALRRGGHQVRTASRCGADVAFDWSDPASHQDAVRDVEGLYLVAPVGVADPLDAVDAFLGRATGAGVRRVVLLSASSVEPGSPGMGQLPAAVAAHAPQWAVLRPTWFATNFIGDHFHARRVREHAEVVSATGDGRVAFIDPVDIAAVAAAALTDAEPLQRDVVLTGPAALSFDDVAAALTDARGQLVRHRRVSVDELAGLLAEDGLPADFACVLAGMDTAIAAGAEERTTPQVQQLTGRAPTKFADTLASAARAARDQ